MIAKQSKKERTVLVGLALLGFVLRLIFPGDVPFIHDEALDLGRALGDAEAGVWTRFGLTNPRGGVFGPIPILYYRFLLWFTHDPFGIVVLKSLTQTAMTMGAVGALWRLFPTFPRWIALVPLLSPYLWQYARDLWDISLMIPLSALCFVAYLTFVDTHRARYLIAAGVLASLCAQIHPITVSLLGALFVHFVCFEHRWWRHNLRWVGASFAAGVVVAAPYLPFLFTQTRAPFPSLGPGNVNFFYGLLGGRLFTVLGYEYFLQKGWWVSYGALGVFALATSIIGALLSFYGIALVAVRCTKTPRAGRRFAADFLALAMILLHCVGMGLQQLINHPHYLFGVWFGFFYCLAVAAERIAATRGGRAAIVGYVSGLAVGLLLVVHFTHAGLARSTEHWGRGLGVQVEEARALNCAGAPVSTGLTESVLRKLAPCSP